MNSTNLQSVYNLILEMDKLKTVFRNTMTSQDRKESTAEHSWSAAMIVIVLMQELKKEFINVNELIACKLALIHDIVEIYAGDVIAFDAVARKDKEKVEADALRELMAVCPEFGSQLHDLWYEFEEKNSIEARIAKAADAICPIFQRLQSRQSYIPFGITIADLDRTKNPHFEFSKSFSSLYVKLKNDLKENNLVTE